LQVAHETHTAEAVLARLAENAGHKRGEGKPARKLLLLQIKILNWLDFIRLAAKIFVLFENYGKLMRNKFQ
jgi:hypothetical protein